MYSHCKGKMVTLFVAVLIKNINVVKALYVAKL